jgi:hypothetical protein
LSRNLGTLTSWNPLGHSRPVRGLLYYLDQQVKGEWNGGVCSTHEVDEKCAVGKYTKEINYLRGDGIEGTTTIKCHRYRIGTSAHLLRI